MVDRALENTRLQADNARLRDALDPVPALLFASPAMERLAELVARVAPAGRRRCSSPARAAPARSGWPRRSCGLASRRQAVRAVQLRGDRRPTSRGRAVRALERGAFTGAVRDRPGLFREADRRHAAPRRGRRADLQRPSQLLRVLQTGEIRPVGEDDRTRKVDVRMIAATHRDLEDRVSGGRFQDDLRWRLDVVRLHVPPLRDAAEEDIGVFARHFLALYTRRFGVECGPIPEVLLARLQGYRWPGNVRELEHAVERVIALSPEGRRPRAGAGGGGAATAEAQPESRVDAYERGPGGRRARGRPGDRSEAARGLGIARVTLYEKLQKRGLRQSRRSRSSRLDSGTRVGAPPPVGYVGAVRW